MMKQTFLTLLITLFTLLSPTAAVQAQPASVPAPAEQAAAEYTLAPGDILNIEVWGREEFKAKDGVNGGIMIRPDGKISFPLLGEIKAEGYSISALTTAITQGLSEYLKQPCVTVNILKFHTTRVYVLGEVNKPGLYEIEKQHNLLDAISIADGYTRDAAKKKVFVIHKGQTDKPIKANLYALLNKGDMSQNYSLNDGDVVYLTSNGRIDFARDIMPFVSAAYMINDINNN